MLSSKLRLLCNASEVQPGTAKRIVVGGLALAAFNLDGEFYVTDDTCTHGFASLSEGIVDGHIIECPWHGGTFDIRSGGPDRSPLHRSAQHLSDRGQGRGGLDRYERERGRSNEFATRGVTDMPNLEQVTERVRAAVGDHSDLDARIKFKFGETGTLYIDGKSVPNQVHNKDEDSDITITVSLENFERIIDKELNPKLALMTGRMRLRGDIRIAMRLDKVFGLE
jgi:nitrite reductase/ring-hydroxylating ferredoxin subunit/putative sterol carrier protein